MSSFNYAVIASHPIVDYIDDYEESATNAMNAFGIAIALAAIFSVVLYFYRRL